VARGFSAHRRANVLEHDLAWPARGNPLHQRNGESALIRPKQRLGLTGAQRITQESPTDGHGWSHNAVPEAHALAEGMPLYQSPLTGCHRWLTFPFPCWPSFHLLPVWRCRIREARSQTRTRDQHDAWHTETGASNATTAEALCAPITRGRPGSHRCTCVIIGRAPSVMVCCVLLLWFCSRGEGASTITNGKAHTRLVQERGVSDSGEIQRQPLFVSAKRSRDRPGPRCDVRDDAPSSRPLTMGASAATRVGSPLESTTVLA
jgi:hypothetical protein